MQPELKLRRELPNRTVLRNNWKKKGYNKVMTYNEYVMRIKKEIEEHNKKVKEQ